MKAFSLRLRRSDKEAAEELWSIFAETKAVLVAVHASWTLTLATGEPDLGDVLNRSRQRALGLLARLERIRIRDDAARTAFAASLRDFAHVLNGSGNPSAVLARSAVTYELGRELAGALWAFELAPEGAPLAAAAATQFTT